MTAHIEQANELLGKAGWQPTDDPATAALAHATLALVEQQRIANLLALSTWRVQYTSDLGAPMALNSTREFAERLRAEASAALGFEKGDDA